MKPGSLATTYENHTNPMDKHVKAMAEISEFVSRGSLDVRRRGP